MVKSLSTMVRPKLLLSKKCSTMESIWWLVTYKAIFNANQNHLSVTKSSKIMVKMAAIVMILVQSISLTLNLRYHGGHPKLRRRESKKLMLELRPRLKQLEFKLHMIILLCRLNSKRQNKELRNLKKLMPGLKQKHRKRLLRELLRIKLMLKLKQRPKLKERNNLQLKKLQDRKLMRRL